jgi:hypothetical protein
VTGFSDGEASFTYSRSGNQLGLYYAVKLTATERPLLEELQVFFGGVGRIYDVAARAAGARSAAAKSAAYFRITHRDELSRVLDHFDRYPLRSNKKQVYEIWRLMVLAKQQFRKPDRGMLDALAEQITALCVRKQPWR